MDEYEPYDSEFAAVYNDYRDGDGIGSTLLPSPVSDAGGSDALMRFSIWYQGVHGYVCVIICLFGLVSNAMNIAVLTRRSMVINAPVNQSTDSIESVQKRALCTIYPFSNDIPYSNYLDLADIASLSTRRNDLSCNFFSFHS